MRALCIVGTDTGVGKTFVAAHLLRFLLDQGIGAGYQKWVSTGAGPVPDDLRFCLEVAGLPLQPGELREQAVYRFPVPASPHLAARLAGAEIDPEEIAARLTDSTARHEFLVIEGVGGVLVPLRSDLLLADLIARLAIPVALVARSGLGTLNHTLLSLEALRARGIPVVGAVFSDSGQPCDARIVEDNLKTIGELGRVRILGRLPRCSAHEEARRAFRPIGTALLAALAAMGMVQIS